MEESKEDVAAQQNTNHSSDGRGNGHAGFEEVEDSGDEVKQHDSELSATSDIDMMEIDDDDEEVDDAAGFGQ